MSRCDGLSKVDNMYNDLIENTVIRELTEV